MQNPDSKNDVFHNRCATVHSDARSLDNILDEFDRALHAGQNPGIASMLRHESRNCGTSLTSPASRTLIEQLIEIEICHELKNNAQADAQVLPNMSQKYAVFGDWAVEHAVAQYDSLDRSLNRVTDREMETSVAEPLKPLEIAARFQIDDRFEIAEKLGCGGMGTVYRAIEKKTGHSLAIKTLKASCPSLLYRLKTEFRSLATLPPHPNVVLLFQLFVSGADAAFTMELIEGADFYNAFAQAKKVGQSSRRQLDLLMQLANALRHVHQQGWLHRDLKSTNVMVTNDDRVVLLDFGLATLLAGESQLMGLAEYGGLRGTAHFISPEQANAQPLSPASDWFSFGVLLYYCVTGGLPHVGDSVEAIIKAKEHQPGHLADASLDRASVRLLSLALNLIQWQPDKRPKHNEVLGCLQSIVSEEFDADIPPNEPGGMASLAKDQPRAISDHSIYVGRQREQESLHGYLSQREQWPLQIEVVGKSGIGKTTFLNHALSTLDRYGGSDKRTNKETWIIRGRCFHQEKVPYPGIDQLIDCLAIGINTWAKSFLEQIVPPNPALLLELFPGLRQIDVLRESCRAKLSDFQTGKSKELATEAFVSFFLRLSTIQPLLLVIDDFQWANEDTAHLLSALVESASAPKIAVLVARRTNDDDGQISLSTTPRTTSSNEKRSIALEPLSSAECHSFFRELQDELPPTDQAMQCELISQIIAQSNGSPLHLWEFYFHLQQGNRQEHPAQFSFSHLLQSRLAESLPEEIELLKIISASELPLDLKIASALFEPTGRIESTTRNLEQRRLLTRSADLSKIEIYHSQVSHEVREFVGSTAMMETHRLIADHAQTYAPDNYQLASEQYLACGCDLKAAQTLLNAANKSRACHGYEKAIYLIEEAILVSKRTDSESDILVDCQILLADTLANTGRCRLAADQYFGLAQLEPPHKQQFEFRQKAIFQYLIDDQAKLDFSLVNAIGKEAGLRLSDNPLLAMISTLFYRLAHGWAKRSSGKDTQRRQQQRDLINVAARALTLSNPLLAGSLSAKLCYLCKRYGSTEQWFKSLDLESIFFFAVDIGRPFNSIGKRLLKQHLQDRSNSQVAQERSAANLSSTVAAYTSEELVSSLAYNERAHNAYKLSPRDSIWELEILAAFRIWVHHYTGDFHNFDDILSSRSKLLGIESGVNSEPSQSPVPVQVLQRLPGYFETYVAAALLRDDIDAARAAIEQVNRLLQHKNYSGRLHQISFSKHYYLAYIGEFEEALRNNLYQQKMMWKVGYAFVPVVTPQILAYEISCRTALACQNPARSQQHHRALNRIVKKLNRRKSGVRRGLVCSIEAYFASRRDDWNACDDAVSEAITAFDSSGFLSFSYLLRSAVGAIEITQKQHVWQQEAATWGTERNIANLKAVHRISVPTFERK